MPANYQTSALSPLIAGLVRSLSRVAQAQSIALANGNLNARALQSLYTTLLLPAQRAASIGHYHVLRTYTIPAQTTSLVLSQVRTSAALINATTLQRLANGNANTTPSPRRIRALLFPPHRLLLIARSVIIEAYNAGQYAALISAGVGIEKRWVTVGDSRVSPGCLLNSSQGWLPLHTAFSSGHQHPLRHPRCRCRIDYRAAATPRNAKGNVNAKAKAKPTGNVKAMPTPARPRLK